MFVDAVLKSEITLQDFHLDEQSATLGNTIFVALGLTAVFNSFMGVESKTDLTYSKFPP